MAQNTIGSMSVKLGLDSGGLLAGLAQAEARLGKFSAGIGNIGGGLGKLSSLAMPTLGSLGAGLSLGALGTAIKSTIDDTGRLVDTASKLDIPVNALEQMELAAKTSGVEVGTLHNAIGKLQEKLGQAVRGEEQARKDFDALGVSWRELAGMDTAQQFATVAEKIGAMGTAYERADGAQLAFGKSGKELITFLLNYKEEMGLSGKVIVKLTEEGADRLDRMGDAWERLKVKVSSGWRALLNMGAEAFEKGVLRGGTWLGLPDPMKVIRASFEKKKEEAAKPAKLAEMEMELINKEMEAFSKVWTDWSKKATEEARTPFEAMEAKLGDLKFAFEEGFLDRGAFDKLSAKARGISIDPLEALVKDPAAGLTALAQSEAKIGRLSEALEAGTISTQQFIFASRQLGEEFDKAIGQQAVTAVNSLATPLESLTAKLAQTREMLRLDLIDEGQFRRLGAKGMLDIEKGIGGLTNRGDVGAMQRGSSEAVSVINRFMNDAGRQRDPQERVAAIMEQAAKIEARQEDLLERIADAMEALNVG